MEEPVKPLLRGVSHLLACIVSIAAAWKLSDLAAGPQARLAADAYSLSMVAMFGASALYNIPAWTPRVGTWLRRLDHGAIFVFIAGSYTPFCMLALHGATGTRLLVLAWIAAGLGVVQSWLWIQAPRLLKACLYVAMGWMVSPYIPTLATTIGGTGVGLLIASGVLYTVGAIVYTLRQPDPIPRVFGYHEVFHAMVIAACVCQFLVVSALVLSA